jgi:hypothetical protein
LEKNVSLLFKIKTVVSKAAANVVVFLTHTNIHKIKIKLNIYLADRQKE